MPQYTGSDSPLQIIQPFTAVVWFAFYSPVIIATCITGLSFIFQNFKGIIYLGFLIGSCVVRGYVYAMSGANPIVGDKTICNAIQYSKYGNPTFSSFVFAFTITYLAYPMFANGFVNYWVFISLLLYFFLDMFIKIYKNCIVEMGDLVLNVLLGATCASVLVSLMYVGGSSKYLFFNEMSSDKEMCYQPSNQTFKCTMYYNGEVVTQL